MKKLFTLIAALFIVLSASATVEKDLITESVDLDNSSYGWYPGLVIDRANFTSAPVGTKLIIEYTLNSGDSHGFRLCTNYANTPLPGFEEDDADHNYNPTADGSYSYEITQETIDLLNDVNAIQYDNVRIVGAGVTVNRIYLQLADEEVIATSINLDDSSYGWYPGYTFDRGIITSAEVGWHIVIDYTLNSGESHGFRLCTNYANTPLPGFEVDDADHNYNPTADGSYSYEITQETIDLLNDVNAIQYDNVRLVGAGVTVTALKLVRKVAEEGGEEATGKSWDFTNLAADVIAALEADAKWESSAQGSGESAFTRYTYTEEIAKDTYVDLGDIGFAAGAGIEVGRAGGKMTGGSTIRVDANNRIQLNCSNGVFKIKNLKAGDVVKIQIASANSEEERTFTITNGDKTSVTTTGDGTKTEETITVSADGDLVLQQSKAINVYTITVGGSTGIQETVAPVKVINNGAIYNLAGQKVNESYKGIVIKNGKKYIQK